MQPHGLRPKPLRSGSDYDQSDGLGEFQRADRRIDERRSHMTTADRHYEFGKNWTRYVKRSFDDERLEIAKRYILSLIERSDLQGLDFLDIGCGSGIHSLAAFRAGAGRIRSFDYDPDLVAATTMLRKYAGEPANWTVERGDVLDDAFIELARTMELCVFLGRAAPHWRCLASTCQCAEGSCGRWIVLHRPVLRRH